MGKKTCHVDCLGPAPRVDLEHGLLPYLKACRRPSRRKARTFEFPELSP